jgi:hypothetical protein
LNDETKSVMYFVRGASFDKKEFKRNLAGSVSYPPVYTVVHKKHKLMRYVQTH